MLALSSSTIDLQTAHTGAFRNTFVLLEPTTFITIHVYKSERLDKMIDLVQHELQTAAYLGGVGVKLIHT